MIISFIDRFFLYKPVIITGSVFLELNLLWLLMAGVE